MIELRGAVKRFGIPPARNRQVRAVTALGGITLSLAAGRALGIVGPNGAGKTTLLALVLGFLKPTSGTVTIAGYTPRDYIRLHGAAYLPERFSLPRRREVRAALIRLAQLERIADAGARADQLLEQFDLAAHARKPIGTLSRGLLQRVGLAQALLAPRELVVLDEPAEGLDPLWRMRLRRLIGDLRAEGRTLLIASHDLHELEQLIDEVMVLDGGVVRDTITVSRGNAEARAYRIELYEPVAAVADVFPDAITEDGRTLTVAVDGAADLSARLAALLQNGALIVSVEPAESLEQRVRSALEPPG